MGVLVCLTGRSCAGKSTLARAVARKLRLPFFSLGDYQRSYFARKGFSSPSEYHARLGVSRTYVGLFGAFSKEIAKRWRASGGRGVVVESLYSLGFLRLLTRAFPGAVRVVARVDAPKAVRFARFFLRERAAGVSRAQARRSFDDLESVKDRVGLARLLSALSKGSARGVRVFRISNSGSPVRLAREAGAFCLAVKEWS